MTQGTILQVQLTEAQDFRIESRLNRFGLNFPLMVAPMVGLSHVATRELVRRYLPKGLDVLIFTEMLSTLRLPSERLDRADELRVADGESFFVPQILGNDEWYIERSLAKLQALQPWGFDINMGCPVKHSLRHNWGVRLMGDADYAAQVVSITRRHTKQPLSVKLRCGIDKGDTKFLDQFTGRLEQAGADWLTIHARPKSQKHKGQADWQLVADLAPKRSIPIVVNGNVQTADDAINLIRNFGLDGVMIGRAITARPWILWQIASRLGYQKAPVAFAGQLPPQSPEEEGAFYLDSLLHLIKLLKQFFPDPRKREKKFRFYLINSHKWLFYGHYLYSKCMKCQSLDEIEQMIEEYRSGTVFPMSQKISLL